MDCPEKPIQLTALPQNTEGAVPCLVFLVWSYMKIQITNSFP